MDNKATRRAVLGALAIPAVIAAGGVAAAAATQSAATSEWHALKAKFDAARARAGSVLYEYGSRIVGPRAKGSSHPTGMVRTGSVAATSCRAGRICPCLHGNRTGSTRRIGVETRQVWLG